MLLRKSFRVWRKYKPRSVLMESREIPDQALLFEARAIAILCKSTSRLYWQASLAGRLAMLPLANVF